MTVRVLFLMVSAALVFASVLVSGCSQKSAELDVAQFSTECMKNCALGSNGCKKLARNESDAKRCDQFFDKCKNECEAKDRPAAPAAAPEPPAVNEKEPTEEKPVEEKPAEEKAAAS